MVAYIQSQLTNPDEIKEILKEVEGAYTLSDGREVRTLMAYLPVKDGVCCYLEFFEKIRAEILHNFVFSCSEIEKKLGVGHGASVEKLFDKAIRKLSKHTAKGELGELILFTLLDVYFKAPKILSKVSMKTNPKMPVFGADGVHGQFHDGKFRVYFGESKLHAKFKPAATDAAKSIKSAKEKYEDEFDLLDSFMDFPGINDEVESVLLELLNPFSEEDLSETIYSPCFIGFSDLELISSSSTEEEFVEKYEKIACEYIEHFFDKVENQDMSIDETALLMLPFSCVDDLVDGFIASVGIER